MTSGRSGLRLLRPDAGRFTSWCGSCAKARRSLGIRANAQNKEIPMRVLPTEVLMQRAQSRPESTAFVFQKNVWTYQKLAQESERVARGLAASGVKAGDRVVLHMMNRPEMLIAYYACFRLGAIAAPLRTAFKFAELAPMLQRLQPALYIGESSLYPNVAAVNAA